MSKPELIIGNKNYSSWSLRPWLTLKVAGINFDETLVRLFENDWDHHKAQLPSGTVPVLNYDGLIIWETLAILEFIAETWTEAKLWPENKHARATARSISNEMHAGFPEVRANMPMNIRASFPGRGRGTGEDANLINRDIRRIEEIWTDVRDQFGKDGDFLFGRFTIADAMYAPIVSRFTTYDVRLNGICHRYMDAIQALPAMIEWSDAARAEPWIIKEDEIDFVEGKWED